MPVIVPPSVAKPIAVRAPDPVMFLRYWNRPDKTAEKIRDGWLLTGDEGRMDEEGYVHFSARADDEQRRQFTLGDAGRELDVDLLAVIEGTQRLP